MRKEQPFILNHTSCVRMIKETYLLCMDSYFMTGYRMMQLKRKNSKFSADKTSLFICECTSSHSSKWRKEQPFLLNHTSTVRMLTKYESNLHTDHKWMHAQVHTAASGEKSNQSFLTTCTSCVGVLTKYGSNLLAEHKWMHKFTQQQVEKEELFNLNHTSCVSMLTKYEST